MSDKKDREHTVRMIDYGACESDEEFLALKRLGRAEAQELFAEEGIEIGGAVAKTWPSNFGQVNFELPIALFATPHNGTFGRVKIGLG
jgi:hypothetical protein